MAFPVILSSDTYTGATSTNSFSPTTVVCNVGDLIIFSVATSASRTLTMTTAGWQSAGTLTSSGVQSQMFWKIAASTSEVVSVKSSGTNSGWCAYVMRITGAQGVTGTVASSSAANSNPPAHDAGAVRDHLWIAVRTTTQQAPSAAPSGYTLSPTADAGIYRHTHATRNLNARVEDPGAFTNTSGPVGIGTFAVWPVEASSPPAQTVPHRRSAYSY